MKSVIAAAVLFVLLLSSACIGSACIVRETEELIVRTVSFPEDAEVMAEQERETAEKAEALSARWREVFPYFAFVTGYTALNRTDDAVIELYGAVRSGAYSDAVIARAKLLDALYRMRDLERLSLSSVF